MFLFFLFFRIQVSGIHPTSYPYCVISSNKETQVSGLKKHTATKQCKFFDHQGIGEKKVTNFKLKFVAQIFE